MVTKREAAEQVSQLTSANSQFPISMNISRNRRTVADLLNLLTASDNTVFFKPNEQGYRCNPTAQPANYFMWLQKFSTDVKGFPGYQVPLEKMLTVHQAEEIGSVQSYRARGRSYMFFCWLWALVPTFTT